MNNPSPPQFRLSPLQGEPTHHPHLAILFITNPTTTIGALGSTNPPDWPGRAEPRQRDLEEEAVGGSETPHSADGVYGKRKEAPRTSPDFATVKGLPPFPHSWTNSQIMMAAVGSSCSRGHPRTQENRV